MTPTVIERNALADRRQALAAALQPSGPEPIKARLYALIGVLPSPTTDSGNADVKVKIYQAALADLPAWAAIEACDMALRGKVGSYAGRYLPAPGELHTAAEKLVVETAQEKVRIERVLNARIEPYKPSEEEQATSIARVREHADKVREGAAMVSLNERVRMAARRKKTRDYWDMKADGQDKLVGDKHRSDELTRAAANQRLAELDYATKPLEVSPQLQAILNGHRVSDGSAAG